MLQIDVNLETKDFGKTRTQNCVERCSLQVWINFSEVVHDDRRCGIIHSDSKDPVTVQYCIVSSATTQYW